MHLSRLFIYPVKALAGFAVECAEIDELGLVGDRRFLVIDSTGRTLTQRDLPKMALIQTALSETELVLTDSTGSSISVARKSISPTESVLVSVWQSKGLLAEDCGRDVAGWLSSFLGVDAQLVRIGAQFRRPILDPQRASDNDLVSFADGYPFLVVSESSLANLNARLVAKSEATVPMNRFRPNLVVSDCEPFAEDGWMRVQIGKAIFRSGGPCSRCIVTTTDQTSATRGVEPLRTLATFRRDSDHPTKVNFGQNLIHETKLGLIRVGDVVGVL
jgi:uncharacterized protein YcbX